MAIEVSPGREEFAALAARYKLVPVHCTLLSDLNTPVSAFLRVADDADYAFLLESVEGGKHWGAYSFVGLEPGVVVELRGDVARIRRRSGWEERQAPGGDATTLLRELMRELDPAPTPQLGPFGGGAVGFLSYDAVRGFERLPATARDVHDVPDAHFFFPEDLLIFDNFKFRLRALHWAYVQPGEDPGAAWERAVSRLEALLGRLQGPLPPPAAPPDEDSSPEISLDSNMGQPRYEEIVRRGLDYIHAGDCIQVVLSQRFEAESTARPFDVYRGLRTLNPSPYMFYLQFPEQQVMGASPETMVRVQDRRMMVRPIAGTRKRGATASEDAALAAEMCSDPKERAEHVMLVDLGRNDVGRVCKIGSVQVDALMRVERYSHVMHLVSDVSGTLRDGEDALSALRAAFPAGTLSGAPKVRAMEIIEELEEQRRGIYGGAAGYAAFDGNLDMAIAIRTLVRLGARGGVGRYLLQAGAGVVADSDPSFEYEETVNKAAAAAQALRMAHAGLDEAGNPGSR